MKANRRRRRRRKRLRPLLHLHQLKQPPLHLRRRHPSRLRLHLLPAPAASHFTSLLHPSALLPPPQRKTASTSVLTATSVWTTWTSTWPAARARCPDRDAARSAAKEGGIRRHLRPRRSLLRQCSSRSTRIDTLLPRARCCITPLPLFARELPRELPALPLAALRHRRHHLTQCLR